MKKHTHWGYTLPNEADRELGEQSFLTLASRIALHHDDRTRKRGATTRR